MDTWPTLSQPISKSSSSKSGRSKGKTSSTWHYPSLHQGTITAATVIEKNNRLKWIRVDGGEGNFFNGYLRTPYI